MVNVVWWGTIANEYGWLKQRLQCYGSAATDGSAANARDAEAESLPVEVQVVQGTFDQLRSVLQFNSVDRLIVAMVNRWQYPALELRQLSMDFPEIPVALCLGDLWMGWKRTGAGHLQVMTHHCIPWYRWCDAWLPWLRGDEAVLGPFPVDRFSVPESYCTTRFVGQGWFIGKDSAQAQYWQEAFGRSVHAFDREVSDELDGADTLDGQLSPDWIVWDDSRAPTWNGLELGMQVATKELQAITRRYPSASLWLAWTLPTWQIVQQLESVGLSFEVLGKPYVLNFSSAALART